MRLNCEKLPALKHASVSLRQEAKQQLTPYRTMTAINGNKNNNMSETIYEGGAGVEAGGKEAGRGSRKRRQVKAAV